MLWKLIVLLRWKWKIRLDNTSTYIIGENQQEHYTFLFDQQTQHTNVVLFFYVEAHATLTVHVVVIDTSMHVKIHCVMRGHGGHVSVKGAYRVSGEHTVIIDTFQHHQSAHTSSTLVMKGVLYGKAQAHYHGTICIEKEARGVCASQENKNIILSNEARVVSIPNLQVLNNEVRCFHGSAVGRFDKEQLFYAVARGIDEKSAERILLLAFFSDVVDGNELSKRLCHE